MKPDQVIALVISWMRTAVLALIMFALLAALARVFGFVLPIKGIDHVTLAYLAGAYWLTK